MDSKKCIAFALVWVILLSAFPWFAFAQGDRSHDSAGAAMEQLRRRGIDLEAFEKFDSDSGEIIAPRSFIVLLAKTIGVQPLFSDQNSPEEEGYAKALMQLGILQKEDEVFLSSNAILTRAEAQKWIRTAIESLETSQATEEKDQRWEWLPGIADGKALTVAEAAIMMKNMLDRIDGKESHGAPPLGLTAYRWTLRMGEQRKVKENDKEAGSRFTPVFGWDHPEIGSLSSAGIFKALKAGRGTITATNGLDSYTVNVEIAGNGRKLEPSNPSYLTDVSSQAKYTVQETAPDRAFHEMEYQQHPGPIEGLASHNNWTGFFRQKGREIRVDLGKRMPIADVSLQFLQNNEKAVLFPRWMKASISLDGKMWSALGQVNHQVSPSSAEVAQRTFSLSFPAVWARYITLSFPVDTWVFARDLSIKALSSMPDVQQAVILPQLKESRKNEPAWMKVPGVDDMLLIYTGKYGQEGKWEKGDFQPVISYISGGKIKGKMFDAFLFLPFPHMEATKKEWEDYLKDLFLQGQQLDALNEAAAWARQNGWEKKKVKVILSLPYPDPGQGDFGSLSFWKESLSFSERDTGRVKALENRYSAVKWYWNELMKKWHEASYANLDLAGIYWFQETINPSIAGEKALIRNVAQLVHSQNQKFYWIPYFGAQGVEIGKESGFDYIFLQPNFYANDRPPEDRMSNAVHTARQYHLGIELEIDRKALTNRFFYDLFYKQLQQAASLGVRREMTLAYYAGTKTIVEAARSNRPQARKIYDDLHRWISGEYEE